MARSTISEGAKSQTQYTISFAFSIAYTRGTVIPDTIRNQSRFSGLQKIAVTNSIKVSITLLQCQVIERSRILASYKHQTTVT
jgi:hypothetical protein